MMRLESVQQIREALSGGSVRLGGTGSSRILGLPEPTLSLVKFDDLITFRPEDLVIRVGAGFRLDDLDALAHQHGLGLPVPRGWLGYAGNTVGGLVATGMPHFWQEQTGSIRDWVIGMTFVSGDGAVVRSGADVVKSVAGFDLHRAMVGSRGRLGAILEVALRLKPLSARPKDPQPQMPGPLWVSRIPLGVSATIQDTTARWAWTETPVVIPPYGWSVHPDGRVLGQQDPLTSRFRENLRKALDPKGVFSE